MAITVPSSELAYCCMEILKVLYSILFLVSVSSLSCLAYLDTLSGSWDFSYKFPDFLLILLMLSIFVTCVLDVYSFVPFVSWAIHQANGKKFGVLLVIHGLVSYYGGGSVRAALSVTSFLCLLVSIVGLYGRKPDCQTICLYLFLEMIAESFLSLIGRGFLLSQLIGLVSSLYPLIVSVIHPRDHLILFDPRKAGQQPNDEPPQSDIEAHQPNGHEVHIEVEAEIGTEGEIDDHEIELT